MKEENNIEKLFQGAFENFEVTPPVSVKMEIDKQLGTKKIKRRWIFWWSTILVLLLAGTAFAVIKSGLVTSSGSGLLASNPDSNTHSKTDGNNAAETTGDPVSAEVNQQNEQSELKDQKKAAAQMDQTNTGKQKASKRTGGKGSPAMENDGESEPLSSAQKNSLKTNSKKRTTYSAKNGAADAQEESSKRSKQKAAQTQNKAAGSPKKKAIKTPLKKKTAFSAGKNNSIAKNEGLIGSEGNSDEVVAIEKNQLPDAKDNQKEASPGSKPDKGEIGKAKTEPADSIADVAAVDSILTPNNPGRVIPPSKRNWMIEIYGGPRFGVKTSKTDFTLKSADSYQIGLGFSRSVNLGPLKYVTLDGEYGAGKESYRQETTTSSVYFVGMDSIPILDTSMTDTLGYTYQNNYDTLNQTLEVNSNSQITRFAFGLKAQFNFNLGSGFGLAVSPGYYYSRSTFKFSDSSGTGSSSSSQILVSLSAYYDWNRFRFRVGLDSRYELMGKNQNAYIDRRKSILFSPQFGIAFKF